MGAVGWMTIIPYRMRSQSPRARRSLRPCGAFVVDAVDMNFRRRKGRVFIGPSGKLTSNIHPALGRLEIKLKRELNETWITGCLELSELRRAEFDGDRLDLAGGAYGTPEWFRVVPYVEEVSSELNSHLLFHRKQLGEGHIPGLVSRSANLVTALISEGTLNQISGKGAGVEESTGNTRRGIRVANDVRTRAIDDCPAAICIGAVYKRIIDGEVVSGGSSRDAGDLPIADQLVENAAGISSEHFAPAEGKIIGVADYEAMANVNVRVAVFRPGETLIAKITCAQ